MTRPTGIARRGVSAFYRRMLKTAERQGARQEGHGQIA